MIIGKIRADQEAVIELEVVGLNHSEKNDCPFDINSKFHDESNTLRLYQVD